MISKKILIVEDDDLMRRSLTFSLEDASYQVKNAANAEDGIAIARRWRPDLVLLDIGLPGIDGLDALHWFKNELVPVIFLTARQRSLDEIIGLELGAEDYVTKPFDMDVLLARIKAVLRRAGRQEQMSPLHLNPLTVGDLDIDPFSRKVTVSGKRVELTPREFDLLYTFALEPGRVIPMAELLTRVWGPDFVGQPQVIYVHVRWLREKLESDPEHPQRILSIHGVGYKLEPRQAI